MNINTTTHQAKNYTQHISHLQITQNTSTNSFETIMSQQSSTVSTNESPTQKTITPEQLEWRNEQKERMMAMYFRVKDNAIKSEAETGHISKDPWGEQYLKRTEENMFENAPEFEAFVYEWIDKGHTAEEALIRAKTYARVGLLEYGDQRVTTIPGLEPGDKKEHGLHLINNDVLKNTVKDFLDNSDLPSIATFVDRFFSENKETPKGVDPFQDLLNKFGITLDELHEKNGTSTKYRFDGDINITEEMAQDKKEFIYDTLIDFFDYHLKKYEDEEEHFDAEYYQKEEMFKSFIKKLETNVTQEKYNLEHGSQDKVLLSQYTQSKENPLQSLNL